MSRHIRYSSILAAVLTAVMIIVAAVFALPAVVHADDLVSVTIGEGTDTTDLIPYCNSWKYSRTQVIYKADDIGADGSIQSISYNVAKADPEYRVSSLEIWMGYEQNEYYDWDSVKYIGVAPITLKEDDVTLVYSGAPDLGRSSGWETIDLDEPFNYSRKNGNLVIVTCIKSQNGSSSLQYYCTNLGKTGRNLDPATDHEQVAAVYSGDDNSADVADLSRQPALPWKIRSARPNIILDIDTSDTASEMHRVTFDADGGEPAPVAQRVADGEKAARPEDPVREGCDFAGWYDGDREYDFDDPVTAPVRLKAKWNKKTYEIRFVDEDGKTVLQTLEVEHGDTPEYTGEEPVKSGEGDTQYVFAGWEPAIREAEGPQTYTAVYLEKSSLADKTELSRVLKAAQDAKTGIRTSEDGSDVGPKFTYVTPDERQAFDDATTRGQEIADDPRAEQSAVDKAAADVIEAQEKFLGAQKDGRKALPAIEKIVISKSSGRQQPASGGVYEWQITFSEGADLSKITSDDFQIQRKPSGADWKNSKCPVAMFDAESSIVEGQAIPDNTKEGDTTNLWRFTYAGECNVSADDFPVITQDGYVFIDRESLDNAIRAAQDIQGGIIISEDGMDVDPQDKFVTSKDKQALDDAISAAEKVAANSRANQKQVDDAAQALNDAIDAYNKAIRSGKKGTDDESAVEEVSHGDYHLISETATVALADIPVREYKSEADGSPAEWFNDRPIEFEFFNSTTQQSEGVYTTHEGTYTDDKGSSHKVQLLSGVKLIKGHYYIVSAHDKDYMVTSYYTVTVDDDGYGRAYSYSSNMANHYITAAVEGKLPTDIKRGELLKSLDISKRAGSLDDVTDARRVNISVPVYYTTDGTPGGILSRTAGATIRLSSPEETIYAQSDDYGLLNVALIEDVDYVVQLVEAENAVAIASFPLTVKDHAENGWPKSIYNHFSCGSVQGLYIVDKALEHARDTTLVSLSGKTSVTGMNFRNDRPTDTDHYFINDRQVDKKVSGLEGKDYDMFIIEAINMYRTEMSRLAAGEFKITRAVPAGREVDKVYYINKKGSLKRLTFKESGGKVTFTMDTLSMYPSVIVYKDKSGEGASAQGKGTTLAAAEKAIAKIGVSSDKDPAGAVFGKLRLRSARQTRNSVTLKWSKVSGARKYILYGNLCGKGKGVKKIATKTGTSFKVTKAAGARLKAGKYYKFIVLAVGADGNVISTSKVVHVATKGGRSGNYKSVSTKARKNKVTVRKGRKFKLGARQIPASGKLKVKKHAKLRYESSNTSIAAVSSKGVIKGRKKGTCYVYAYTQSGTYKKVKVTVK